MAHHASDRPGMRQMGLMGRDRFVDSLTSIVSLDRPN